MKKTLNYLLLGLTVVLLAKCTNKQKEKLEGIWRLDKVEVNGTVLPGNSLGNQLWEFNDANGYLILIAGAKEKGTYTLKGDKLLLKSATVADKPETEYRIAKLDTAELHLAAEYDKNKTYFTFVKAAGEEVASEED